MKKLARKIKNLCNTINNKPQAALTPIGNPRPGGMREAVEPATPCPDGERVL